MSNFSIRLTAGCNGSIFTGELAAVPATSGGVYLLD